MKPPTFSMQECQLGVLMLIWSCVAHSGAASFAAAVGGAFFLIAGALRFAREEK